MFTGIIEEIGTVRSVGDGRLVLSHPASFKDIATGSSIAVAGVCLSVIAFDDASITFDVVPETLSKTTLGSLKEGDGVNLERAMRAESRFEGHIVQGHVEGRGAVISVSQSEAQTVLTLSLPQELVPIVVSKGSITLDGVSLTVATVEGEACSVALIPHTLEHTTLGSLHQGDLVNVETDILGRYVHALLPPSAP